VRSKIHRSDPGYNRGHQTRRTERTIFQLSTISSGATNIVESLNMSASSASTLLVTNPWENDPIGSAFGHAMRQLIMSPLSAGQVNEFQGGKSATAESPRFDFLDRLRAADAAVRSRRMSSLNRKLDNINSEVAGILSEESLADIENMLLSVSSSMESISSHSILENISKDLFRKRTVICIDADVQNQRKINQVISFIDGLRKLDAKAQTGGSPASKDSDAGAVEILEENRESGEVQDLKQSLMDVVTRYNGVAESAESLREHYAKLKDFHREFRDHIFRGF
jgi:hypothetical protein